MKSVWYNESVFYHIYPLGLCGAPEENDFSEEPVERLNKVIEWVTHIKELGVTALYFGPLFESHSHGYDTVDYFNLDRRLGINATLKRVVKELHSMGIKVVLDGVFNHVSRNFFAFNDLIIHGESSIYKDWFKDVTFNSSSPMGDSFSYGCWSGHFALPALNLQNTEVRNYLFSAISMWVTEFDIDGLRLDVAEDLDVDFMKELSTFCKNIKDDFWLLGEVIHGDYNLWANPKMLHSTTNYECYKGMYSSFNDGNMFEIAHSLKRLYQKDSGIYRNLSLYNFLDNHDVDRISSVLKNYTHIYPLYILMFGIPGIPSIYYGSEWGVEGIREEHSDRIVRPTLDLDKLNRENSRSLIDVIARLSWIWNTTEALRLGSYNEIIVEDKLIAFEREYNGQKFMVVVNSDDKNRDIKISNYIKNESYDVLNSEIIPIINHKTTIPSNWGRIIELK